MSSADVAKFGGDPVGGINTITNTGGTTFDGHQMRWKKVYGTYDIEIVDPPEWPTVDCTPINVHYLPSPNFYPPDEQAGTPGGYGCFDNLVFECMHESCNDPARHFTHAGADFALGNYLTEFKDEDSNTRVADWLTSTFVYNPTSDQYKTTASNEHELSGGVRRFITVEDTNQLLWKQIRAVAPTILPTPVEKCAPW